jgi:hypothetical protein
LASLGAKCVIPVRVCRCAFGMLSPEPSRGNWKPPGRARTECCPHGVAQAAWEVLRFQPRAGNTLRAATLAVPECWASPMQCADPDEQRIAGCDTAHQAPPRSCECRSRARVVASRRLACETEKSRQRALAIFHRVGCRLTRTIEDPNFVLSNGVILTRRRMRDEADRPRSRRR